MNFASPLFLGFGRDVTREGKTARTMLHKLSYAVYTFVFPIYFGYTGFQANFADATILKNFIGVVSVVLLSISGKILGAIAACYRLKIPMKEGIVLGLLLNLKGHFDVLIVGTVRAKEVFVNLRVTKLNSMFFGAISFREPPLPPQKKKKRKEIN